MKFTLLIQGAPIDSQASDTALRFARAALAKGHQIHRIFFYRSGVYCANRLTLAPQDEPSLPDAWQALIKKENLDAVVCIANAIRRGITNESESKRFGKEGSSLIAGAELSGLGQLASATLESDRTITFGGGS